MFATGLQYAAFTFASVKQHLDMKKTVFVIIAVSAAALAAVVFSGKRSAAEHHDDEHAEADYANIPLTEAQIKAVKLATSPVEYREMNRGIKANGQLVVRAQNTAEVSSTVQGVVRKIFVNEGDKIGKGRIVAMVENPEVVALQRDYYSACKETEFAKSELDRQKLLASQGAGLGKNLQQASAQYSILSAKQSGMARQLSQFGISVKRVADGKFTTEFPLRSPIGGTVGKINAALGSYVDMQTPVMTVCNNSAVECDLNVFEKDIAKVKRGAKVLVSLTNSDGKTAEGYVSGVNENFNEGDRSVAVHVKFNRPDSELFGGMYVTGLISTGTERVEAVPSKAIVRDGNRSYVFVHNVNHSLDIKKTHHFRRCEVKTGMTEDGYTQVDFVEHVNKDLPVVTDNSYYLASAVGEHGEHNH